MIKKTKNSFIIYDSRDPTNLTYIIPCSYKNSNETIAVKKTFKHLNLVTFKSKISIPCNYVQNNSPYQI